MSRLSEALRLSVGTFSAVPTRPPRRVDRATAGLATVIAPLAVLPVGLLVAAVAWVAREAGLPWLAVGALAVGAGAIATRGFHLDGLADTVDALASSYDRDRALAVARTGDVGPAGASALALILLLQSAAAGTIAGADWGPAAVGAVWCLARAGATVGLLRGVPAARADGLGAAFAGSVPVVGFAVVWLLVAAAGCALAGAIDQPMLRGVAAAAIALAACALLVAHVTRRLGGIVGDAIGACVELALAALLLTLAAVS